jgi:hypothetical protein
VPFERLVSKGVFGFEKEKALAYRASNLDGSAKDN